MTAEELKEMLRLHRKWLVGDGGQRADLAEADLAGAILIRADLSRAVLTGADLDGAILRGAILGEASLHRAILSGADLSRAVLTGADLDGAILPSPPAILLARWGEVSDGLCVELMRYDAANHPKPEMFDEWAKGGSCPMSVGWERSACFVESRDLWSPGPALPALELVMRLFAEKGINR